MSPIRSLFFVTVALALPLSFLWSKDLGTEPKRPNPERYAEAIAAFAEQEAATGGIVFTGSSSIKRWNTLATDFPDLPVLNRGFGGSIANDLIAHFDTIIARHQPRIVVVYTGGNDIATGLSPEIALQDYSRFLEKVHERFPKTQVIVNSVKIAESRITQMPDVHALNRLLKTWCAEKNWVRYIDTSSFLADDQGQPIPDYYVSDKLHLSEAGYAEWVKRLDPVLREEWNKVKDNAL